MGFNNEKYHTCYSYRNISFRRCKLAYAAKTDPNVWADSDSKEWGNTPESVKYVLSNVQISRSQGNNGNNKQTDLFLQNG